MSRQLQRNIDRHQGNIRNLETKIQLLEHSIVGKKSHLSSLKEALACESKVLHMEEKLQASSDLTWVSFVLQLYSESAKGTMLMLGQNIFSDFHFYYIVPIHFDL